MIEKSTREQKILSALRSLVTSGDATTHTSIAQVAAKTGLGYKDACLGLVKLWLIDGAISVQGFLPVDSPFEICIKSPLASEGNWEGKRGTIGGDREGSRAIKINLLKNNHAGVLLRQENVSSKDSLPRTKQGRERNEDESVREGEKREMAELLRQELGEPKVKGLYETITEKYSKDVILFALRKTLEVPAGQIKKTRLALFRFLLKKYSDEKAKQEILLEKVINNRNAEDASYSTLEGKASDVTLNKMPAGELVRERSRPGKN